MRIPQPIIWLVLVPLATSCWTFREITEPGSADASSDTSSSDTSSGDTSSDISAADMATDVATTDTGSPGDMGNLTVEHLMCNPGGHRYLDPQIQGNGFERQIAFTGFRDPGGLNTAEVAWIEGGHAYHSQIDLSVAPFVPSPAEDFPMVPTQIMGAVAMGADVSSNSYIWGVTGDACPTVDFWWGGQDDSLVNSIPATDCNTNPPALFAMEAAGGLNPFTGRADVPPAIVWQSNEQLVVSNALDFGIESSIQAQWSGYPLSRNTFTLTTHGELLLLPDTDGNIYSWNVTQPPPANPTSFVTPPQRTTILGVDAPGLIDVVALAADLYVVARVLNDSSIVIERWSGRHGTNEFEAQGPWYRIQNLIRPGAIELATFSDGFALWYEERNVGGGESRWTIQPFLVDADRLGVYDCPLVFTYASTVRYQDNDLLAFTEGSSLLVLGAVHYVFTGDEGTDYINVEGSEWPDIF